MAQTLGKEEVTALLDERGVAYERVDHEAVFTMEGMAQTAALISHYLGNASLLLNACRQAGMRVWGGENAPYVWVRVRRSGQLANV